MTNKAYCTAKSMTKILIMWIGEAPELLNLRLENMAVSSALRAVHCLAFIVAFSL
jgi:hypothetical protein